MNTQRAIWWNEGWRDVHISAYASGGIRIDLTHDEYEIKGLPYAIVTRPFPDNFTCHAEQGDLDDYALIKSCDENAGVLECLVNAGIVHAPESSLPYGSEKLYICKVDFELLQDLKLDKQMDDFIDRKEKQHKPGIYKRRNS